MHRSLEPFFMHGFCLPPQLKSTQWATDNSVGAQLSPSLFSFYFHNHGNDLIKWINIFMITGLAMAEYEKKLHAGDNLIGSTRIVLAIQSTSSTTLFKYCKDISQASRRILLSLCMEIMTWLELDQHVSRRK